MLTRWETRVQKTNSIANHTKENPISPDWNQFTLKKSSQVIFHMKSGVVVLPRLPLLLVLKAAFDVVCSLDRRNRSMENTFSWQQAKSNWKKSPESKNRAHCHDKQTFHDTTKKPSRSTERSVTIIKPVTTHNEKAVTPNKPHLLQHTKTLLRQKICHLTKSSHSKRKKHLLSQKKKKHSWQVTECHDKCGMVVTPKALPRED